MKDPIEHSTKVVTVTGDDGKRHNFCSACLQRSRESGRLPVGMIVVVNKEWHEGVCSLAETSGAKEE